MSRLVILVGLALVLALALPGSTEATSLNEIKKLTASDAQAGEYFGRAAAISIDTVVVGAQSKHGFAGGGESAYIFQRDQGGAGNWGEVKKLTASDAQPDDQFGFSVTLSGDTTVVGAWQEDAGGTDAGAAYVLQRDEGGQDNWGEVKKLTALRSSGVQPLRL